MKVLINKKLIVVVLSILGVINCAHAGYISPSYAGTANSTHSVWTRDGAVWDSGTNAEGTFTSVGNDYPLSNHDGGCGGGQHCLNIIGSDLEFFVPNFVDELPTKLIRVQFKYTGGGVGLMPQVFPGINAFDPAGGVTSSIVFSSDVTVDGGFNFFYQDIVLHPNPDWEKILVSNSSGFDLRDVVIDTVSIPSPSAQWLLFFGVLCLVYHQSYLKKTFQA